ncbi:hypothetical protein E4O04_06000 [Treponema sp. OMZ 799]|uniref:hypothetical protein n=1 Tax=Treponema sp. OMZ 799 TaxID=2563668 RepID=UPI0020A5154C|nr:hypothetical protein [Treponema sp. OMZ 799]UTC77577.1 hypothetical protein E4O04_06000 [Treponema sp. OMZ 799]
MEFDKLRVYTALNADELQIGSKCIFADAVGNLQDKVENNNEVSMELALIKPTDRPSRFEAENGNWYLLAYLIEPPAEPKYKPFKDIDKAMEAIKKHGGWIKKKSNRYQYIVIAKSSTSLRLSDGWFTLEAIFYDYVFADDGTPCGELAEE